MNDPRNLPPLPNMRLHRREVLELLTDEMYGRPGEYKFEYSVVSERECSAEFAVKISGRMSPLRLCAYVA